MITKKKSYFWFIQITGWLALGGLNWLIQKGGHPPFVILLLNTCSLSIGGLLMTSVFYVFLNRRKTWLTFKWPRLISYISISTLIVAISWFLLVLALFIPFFNEFHLSVVGLLPNLINLYILILLWTLLYMGFNLIRYFHVSTIEKLQLEVEVQKARLGALKSQINPHFMFNAINNIRALILEDKEAARQMLTRFAELLRYSLQYSEFREVTLAEELNMLDQYIDLLKIQYEDRLQYECQVDSGLMNISIPPMILQLLVENAVKHGVALSEEGGSIIVKISMEKAVLNMQVQNTGNLAISNQLENTIGVGLKNITERLRLLYGDKAIFTITDADGWVYVNVKIQQQ